MSARQTYRRVKKLVLLQWRGASIVLVIIAEVVFFSVVFVSMDNSSQINEQLLQKATPWLTCLALTQGDKNQCLSYAEGLVKSEGIVLAVLIILGVRALYLVAGQSLTDVTAQRLLVSYVLRSMGHGPWLDGTIPNKVSATA